PHPVPLSAAKLPAHSRPLRDRRAVARRFVVPRAASAGTGGDKRSARTRWAMMAMMLPALMARSWIKRSLRGGGNELLQLRSGLLMNTHLSLRRRLADCGNPREGRDQMDRHVASLLAMTGGG